VLDISNSDLVVGLSPQGAPHKDNHGPGQKSTKAHSCFNALWLTRSNFVGTCPQTLL